MATLPPSLRPLSLPQDDTNPLPSLERNVFQLLDAAQKLRGGTGTNDASSGALRLLGSSNFDIDQLERELHQIAPTRPQVDPGDLCAHHEQVVASTVEEAVVATRTETEHQLYHLLDEDWEQAKRELVEDLEHEERGDWRPVACTGPLAQLRASMSISSNPLLQLSAVRQHQDDMDRNGLSAGSERPITPFSPSPFSGELALRTSDRGLASASTRMLVYAAEVKRMPLGTSDSEELVKRFKNAAESVDDPESADMVPTWALVCELVRFRAAQPGGGGVALLGARRFLESRYLEFVRGRIELDGASAAVRGTVVAEVRTWLTLVARNPLAGCGTLGEQLRQWQQSRQCSGVQAAIPEWAVIYYALRCGAWGEVATALLKDVEWKHSLQLTDGLECARLQRIIRSVASQDPQSRHTASALSELDKDAAALRSLPDANGDASCPWRRAVYQLLACNHTRPPAPGVVANIQDFMWMKLCFALMPVPSEYCVTNLAQDIKHYGPAHFQADSQPYLYCRLLLMCGEAARAVAFLASKGGERFTDAVHLAVVLQQCGTELNGSKSDDGPLLCIARAPDLTDGLHGISEAAAAAAAGAGGGLPHLVCAMQTNRCDSLDLGGLVRVYVERYVLPTRDLCLAVQYLLQLRKPTPDHSLTEEGRDFLIDLLLQSREYNTLLGDHAIGSINAVRIPHGVLIELLPVNEVQQLIQDAARRAEAQGRAFDALQLYLRCGSSCTTRAVELLNSLFAATLDPFRPPAEHHGYLKGEAMKIEMAAARGEQLAVDLAQLMTMRQLLRLAAFFEATQNARGEADYNAALEKIGWLLPRNRGEVGTLVESFGELQQCVVDHAFSAVQSAMHCVKALGQAAHGVPARSIELQQHASALMTFVGLLRERFHVRSDVAARLAQEEVGLLF